MKIKIYLAGPITDPDPNIQKANLWRFYEKARELRTMGFDVYNPVKNEPPQGANTTWEEFLAQDLRRMVNKENCTHIYMQKGWKKSKGARLELAYALAEHLEAWYETD